MAMTTRRRLGLAVMITAAIALGPPAALAAPPGAPAPAQGQSPAVSRAFNNVGITDARTLAQGQLDSKGSSFSATSLAEAGFGPGARISVGGIDFNLPRTVPGTPDNISPSTVPTTIKLSGQGNAIAFLATTTSNNRPFNVTVKYQDRTELKAFATTNTWTTQTPDELGIVKDAFRVPGRNTPTTQNANQDTPYGMFVSGINIDPHKEVKEIAVSGNGAAHIFDARIATVPEPFGVDSRGGRTPQPNSCDPLVQGQGICDAQEAGIFEKADPSAHLQYKTATGELPADANAFYNEITPLSSAPGTYFMTNGFNGGYFGIQELDDSSKIAIFSIFGPGKGEVPDDKLSSQVLYAIPGGDLVIHGEYAGGPSIRIPFDWDLGKTYSTMVTEQADVSDGNARIVTAWINKNTVGKTPDWTRLMTVRTERPATQTRLAGQYSFVEDFVRDDKFTPGRARTASYGNAYTFSPSKDRWVPLSKVSFTGQMSRLFTIQNDAFPTPGEQCKVTETVTGGSIPADQARSNVNSIWDTSSKSCTSPGMVAPIEAVRKGAPRYVQETFAGITAELDGQALVLNGSPFANDEAVSVSVDGLEVPTTASANAGGDLVDVRIELTGPLPAGSHEVVVTGASSGLSGSAILTVP